MVESDIAFHLDRVRQYGVDQSHLTSGLSVGEESLKHAGIVAAIMFAGNQEPPYEDRLRLHGDFASPEVLLHPDELALLPGANQFVALIASGLSGRDFRDR